MWASRHCPARSSSVDDPIEVAGVGTGFEGTLQCRVRDNAGNEIAQRHFQAGGTGIWGNYFFRIDIPGIPANPRGTIEVYEISAKDSTEAQSIRREASSYRFAAIGVSLVRPRAGMTILPTLTAEHALSACRPGHGARDIAG